MGNGSIFSLIYRINNISRPNRNIVWFIGQNQRPHKYHWTFRYLGNNFEDDDAIVVFYPLVSTVPDQFNCMILLDDTLLLRGWI